MTFQLPKPVSTYLESINANDENALDRCLTANAHVYDKGEEEHLHGLRAIKKWFVEGNEKYQLRSETEDAWEEGGKVIVKAVSSGNFPTSPQTFFYRFTIEDDLIADIEIIP